MESRATLNNKNITEYGNIVLLIVLLLYNSVVVLWPILLTKFSGLKTINVYVSAAMLGIMFVYCFLRFGYKLTTKAFLFPMIYLMWIAISALVNEPVREELKYPIYWTLTQCLPAFILIFNIIDYKNFFKRCVRISYVVFILYVIAYVFDDMYGLDQGYMVISYAMLPFVLFITQDAFRKPTVKNILYSVVGIGLIFIKGGRGVLVCTIVLIAINIIIDLHGRKRYGLFAIAIAVVLFIQSSAYLNLLRSFNEYLDSHGVYSRTITKMVEEEFTDDNGRMNHVTASIKGISMSPYIGYGFCGDRIIISEIRNTGRIYPHNILLEWMLQLGIFGGVFLLLIVAKAVQLLLKSKNIYYKMWIMVLIPLAFVKLMLSSTYVSEIPFFMMLAIVLSTDEEKLKAIDEAYVEEENDA